MKNGCFTKHPLKDGCLEFQEWVMLVMSPTYKWFVYWGFNIYIPLDGENLGPLRILGMSWGVKTTCLEALFGVSLGGFGVSIGGVRSLRDCRISRWKHLLRCSMGLLYLRATFRGLLSHSSGLQVSAQAPFANLPGKLWCRALLIIVRGSGALNYAR